MTANQVDIRTGVVRPIACYQAGWTVIKDQYWLIFGVSLVGMIIGGAVPFAILMGPMMCGIWKCLLAKSRGRQATFDMLFKGFDHFLQSLIACLIMIVPVMLVTIPLTMLMWGVMLLSFNRGVNQGAEPAGALVSMMLLMVIMFAAVMVLSLVLGAFFVFTFPLIVDRGLTGIEAVKTSARAVLRNPGGGWQAWCCSTCCWAAWARCVATLARSSSCRSALLRTWSLTRPSSEPGI
jgi:uncharacterized membrane protein